MSKRYLAGIGSREVPEKIGKRLQDICAAFCKLGYILRSGHADGSDWYCEEGCYSVNGAAEIFLPWAGFGNERYEGSFNNMKYILPNFNDELKTIAKSLHHNWTRLSEAGAKCIMRNVCQILGEKLDSPVEFVVSYNKGDDSCGGTGFSQRLAKSRNIPVYDIGKETEKTLEELRDRYAEAKRVLTKKN